MRWATLIVACLQVCGHATGQVYFDSLYDGGVFSNSLEGIWGKVAPYDSGYVFVSQTKDGSQTEARLWAVKTNSFGIKIQQSIVGNSNQMYRVADMVKSSTGYIVLSRYAEFNPILVNQYRLTFLNEDLSTNTEFTYGDSTSSELPFHLQSCSNGGYLLVGQYNDSANSDGDMQAIRVTNDGSLVWDKKFGGTEYESCNSSIQAPDGGFFILGWTRSFGAGQRDFYLVRTDSLGVQVWQKTYGGGGDEVGYGILSLLDGNYLLTGAGSQGSSTSIGRLYKIRPDGIVLWAKTYLYPGNSGNNLYKTIEMPNGDLVSVGLTDMNSNDNGGWLVRTDSDGNVIWHREYNKNQYTDLFYSVLATEDGGYLLSGQARNEFTLSQDAWLLKVDSVGCPYPNCLVGVDEVDKSKVVVDVWPNPVSDILNIEFQHQEKAEYCLFDMSGRLMAQATTTQMRETIDVSTFENGLYLLTIIQGEMKTTLKVVVQR